MADCGDVDDAARWIFNGPGSRNSVNESYLLKDEGLCFMSLHGNGCGYSCAAPDLTRSDLVSRLRCANISLTLTGPDLCDGGQPSVNPTGTHFLTLLSEYFYNF